MEIVAGKNDLRIGYFYLNTIFAVVGRKRNAFAIIECNIVVDNIATNLKVSKTKSLNMQPVGALKPQLIMVFPSQYISSGVATACTN